MTTEITTTKQNGIITEAENDLFAWKSFEPDYLTYKPTGQKIYQMVWYEWQNSTDITDQTIIIAVNEFRSSLEILKFQETLKNMVSEIIDALPETHGYGYCDKCQSYCYGDCGAN
jgi:hypothetical protein